MFVLSVARVEWPAHTLREYSCDLVKAGDCGSPKRLLQATQFSA